MAIFSCYSVIADSSSALSFPTDTSPMRRNEIFAAFVFLC